MTTELLELHPHGTAPIFFKTTNPILRKWVQFRVDAIPHEPPFLYLLQFFL